MTRLRSLFRRRNDDLAREIDAHIAERVDELIEDGLTEADARAQASREFGNRTLEMERSREVWRWWWLDLVKASFRDAFRAFRRNAGTIGICLLVLGVSTGLFVTTIVVADALVFRPLRLPGIDRIISVGGLTTQPGIGWTFHDWWGQAPSIEKLTRWDAGLTELTTDDGRFVVQAAFIEPAFSELFEVRPLIGRTLGPNDFEAGTPVPVVINETTWNMRFARDPAVIGATIAMTNTPVVIVGVLPVRSAFRHDVQVWIPRPVNTPIAMVRPTGNGTHARLIDGATLEDARRDIQALGTRLNAEFTPQTGVTYFGTLSLATISEWMARPLRIPVLALVVGTFAVLTMALANAATLLLGLVLDRRQELAVRASLGAARRRLVGQIGFESTLIGAIAGAVGGIAGVVLLGMAQPLVAPLSPYLSSADAAWAVLRAGVGVGSVLGLFVGLVPLSLSLAWKDWNLLQHRIADRGSRRGRRLRSTLVGVQVAAAMMLVTVAGVAIQTFLTANKTSLGFDPTRVLAARVMVPTGIPAQSILDTITSNARNSDLVSTVATAGRLPVVDRGGMRYVGPSNIVPARILDTGPGFFRAMGIPLVAGRDFADDDASNTAVIVSQSLARRLWPDQSPLGQRLNGSEVIGVASDIQEQVDSNADWPDMGASRTYHPLSALSTAQADSPQTIAIVMQCAMSCDDAMPRVDAIARAAGATVMDITSLQAALDASIGATRMRSVAAMACGIFGLVLAITGIYGAIRHVVAARIQEVTIRMALGATPSQARAVVFRYGAVIVTIGVSVGAGLAWGLLSMSQPLFYGVTALDPLSYAIAASALIVGGLLAAVGPALDIGRINTRRLLGES